MTACGSDTHAQLAVKLGSSSIQVTCSHDKHCKLTPARRPTNMPAMMHTKYGALSQLPKCTQQLGYASLMASSTPSSQPRPQVLLMSPPFPKNGLLLPLRLSKAGPCSEAPPQATPAATGIELLQLVLLALGAAAFRQPVMKQSRQQTALASLCMAVSHL